MHNSRQAFALATFAEAVGDAYKMICSLGAAHESARTIALYLALTLSRMAIRMSEASNVARRARNNRKSLWLATGFQLHGIMPRLTPFRKAPAVGEPLSDGLCPHRATYQLCQRTCGCSAGGRGSGAFSRRVFDAVLTDPPYYDSVPYSHLSDMQYVWLHRALAEVLPEYFPTPLTPKTAEIVQTESGTVVMQRPKPSSRAIFVQHFPNVGGCSRKTVSPW